MKICKVGAKMKNVLKLTYQFSGQILKKCSTLNYYISNKEKKGLWRFKSEITYTEKSSNVQKSGWKELKTGTQEDC